MQTHLTSGDSIGELQNEVSGYSENMTNECSVETTPFLHTERANNDSDHFWLFIIHPGSLQSHSTGLTSSLPLKSFSNILVERS